MSRSTTPAKKTQINPSAKKPSLDVLGIGNAIMDVIAPVDDAFLKHHNIAKGGMTLIDEASAMALHKALSAQSDKDHKPVEIAGGSAANTMVGIASLGVSSAYVGKVANDPLGKRFTNGLRESGLIYDTTPTSSGPSTARCIIAVTEDGERSMSTFLGATTQLTKRDIIKSQIESARIVYLEGYLFDSEAAKAAFVKAAEIAQAAGRKVALTLSDSFCVNMHRESFKHLVEHHVDILFANEAELLALYETETFETALKTLSKVCNVACVTRGEKGSVIVENGTHHTISAMPVKKIIDTTGAGDQYAAGVLAARAMGMDWADCGRLGSLCAAEVISHYGARPEKRIQDLI